MPYMLYHEPCVNCKFIIAYNKDHCPSIRVEGQRKPLCRECFDKWNEIHRTSKGLEPVKLHPKAYEPAEFK